VEPAAAKLEQCMKMKAASPEQMACLKEVQGLRQMAVSSAKALPAPPAPAKAPAAAAKVEVPPEVKKAAAELGVAGAPAALGGEKAINIQGMDLQTAMMAIQSQRASLLESQLKGQMESIQQRNESIARLNSLLGKLKPLRPAGTDPNAWGNLGANKAEGKATYDLVKAAGLTLPTGASEVNETGSPIYDAQQKTFDAWAEQIKGKIDALNNSQQMDMLRMQSLTNKRNEAFDLMTSFIKKMQDNRSAIIGNMR
jgi:hypothetical protein